MRHGATEALVGVSDGDATIRTLVVYYSSDSDSDTNCFSSAHLCSIQKKPNVTRDQAADIAFVFVTHPFPPP